MPKRTPVKLNIIEIKTIIGFDIELNWKTSNKTIKPNAVINALDKKDWFSACSSISPVNL